MKSEEFIEFIETKYVAKRVAEPANPSDIVYVLSHDAGYAKPIEIQVAFDEEMAILAAPLFSLPRAEVVPKADLDDFLKMVELGIKIIGDQYCLYHIVFLHEQSTKSIEVGIWAMLKEFEWLLSQTPQSKLS